MNRANVGGSTLALAKMSIIFAFSALTLSGCFHETDAGRLRERLRGASQKLQSDNRILSVDFTWRPTARNPYVIVFLPPQLLTSEMIAALDLPLEAKEWLDFQVKDRSFPGPTLGFLESKHAEWHPLDGIASVPHMLYVWKQPGEEIVVDLRMRSNSAEISALR